MRHGWRVLAALTCWGCATHTAALKGTAQPIGPSPFASERATEIWSRASRTLTTSEAAELRTALRDDPEREVRLAAAWSLAQASVEGEAEKTPAYDESPRLEHQASPGYPKDAFERGIQGVVRVQFLIDEEGAVAHAEVRESIPELDAEALRTIHRWRFRPARLAGRPVPTLAEAPVTFRILGKTPRPRPSPTP
jgi:TonB family protein